MVILYNNCQIILALFHTYNGLEDRCLDDLINIFLFRYLRNRTCTMFLSSYRNMSGHLGE